MFGVQGCAWGNTRKKRTGCCEYCDRVSQVWGRGNCFLGQLTTESAQYVAGYTTKKLTRPDDERLEGREPEFARMSKRPAIGSGILHEVASRLLELNLEDSLEDVPATLAHGGREWPLGTFLRRKLRTLIGRDARAPEATIARIKEEVRHLREAAQAMAAPTSIMFRSLIIQEGEQGRKNMAAKQRIRKTTRHL